MEGPRTQRASGVGWPGTSLTMGLAFSALPMSFSPPHPPNPLWAMGKDKIVSWGCKPHTSSLETGVGLGYCE